MIQEPKVSFNSVDIAGVTLRGVDLIARVDVENPNGISIPMPNIDWELFLNKNPFSEGVLENNNQTIPKNGIATIDVPVNVTYEKLYSSLSSLLNLMGQKEVPYDLAIKLTFDMPIIKNLPYKLDYSGVIPLP
jgi:LEA14-like dessication related protein